MEKPQLNRYQITIKEKSKMISENNIKFIIDSCDQNEIIDIIRGLKSNLIMNNIIMTRVIYQLPRSNEDVGNNQDCEWIRIRTGDVDCSGNCRCTITYKSKKKNGANPQNAKLEVDDYYEAMHMLDLFGFKKTSTQQTRRTKYVCHYEDVKYTICFDIWPELEELTFVSIDAAPNAELLDVESFLDLLNINDYKLNRPFVDVDTEYYNKYGKPSVWFFSKSY